MTRRVLLIVAILSTVLLFASCDARRGRKTRELVFWHTLTGLYKDYLDEIVDEFNSSRDSPKVRAQSMLGYNQIYRKTKLALMSGRLPDIAVAMESMVTEYYPHGVLVDIDRLADESELADYFEPVIETNRYEEFDGKLLSFPFTKSILMMYVNMDMIREAGFSRPPETWEEFIRQARAIKAKRGIVPYALSIDASTVDAFVFSFGGRVYDPQRKRTAFSEPAGLKTFRLIRRLAREGLAHRINYRSRNDRIRFLRREAAFVIRSSSGRPYMSKLIADDFDWDMAMIPHGKGAKPATVLFGANVCIFRSTPGREKDAWEFVKFLTSRDVTARWGTITGYLPVRKSALRTKVFRSFLTEAKQNARAVSNLVHARFEPKNTGWQEMRLYIEKAEGDVFEGRMTPEEAVRWLDETSEKVFARARVR